MPFNNELTENNGTGGAAAGEDAYAGKIIRVSLNEMGSYYRAKKDKILNLRKEQW